MQIVNNRLLHILKYLLGWPFSILAFFFIIRIIAPQIPSFAKNIHNLNVALLAIGSGSFILYYLTRAFIWHRLLRVHTREVTYKQSAYYWALAEIRRYIPGNFWALLGRTILFSDVGMKKKDTGKLVLVEIAIYMVGAATAALLSVPYFARYYLPILDSNLRWAVASGLVLVWILCIHIYKYVPRMPRVASAEIFLLLFLSSIANFFFGIGTYFTIASFAPLPIDLFFQLTGFFTFSFVMGFSSLLTPAGFGVREGIIISGLSKIIPITLAAVGALFARIMLILSEVIFILIIALLYKTKNKYLLRIETWIANHKHEAILIFLCIIYISYITVISFLRHDHFYTGRFDLGNMAQTVWNTTQGRIFQFTNPNGTEEVSRLAFHADFILILLAPFYAIFPSPKTLLFIQAFIVGLGGIFVYLIARDKLKDKNVALAFSFSYLINPALQRANLYDFHSVTMATTFLLATYYFYYKKKYLYFALFALLAAITKEQIWSIIALFGAMMFLFQKKRLIGAAVFVSGIAMSYYLISVAIPNAHGANHFALSFFSELGDNPRNVVQTIIFSPDKILGIMFREDRILYLRQLLSPLGYLPLAYPFFMILAAPDLLINLLSNNAQFRQLYYQYTAAITPFLYISSIFAVSLIMKYIPKKLYFIFTVYIVIMAISAAHKHGPLPGAKEPSTYMFTKQVREREYINRELAKIPQEASVASSNNIGAHLTHRRLLYTLPLGLEKADVIVFLLNDSEQPTSRAIEEKQLASLRKDNRYQKTAEKGAFVVFTKK